MTTEVIDEMKQFQLFVPFTTKSQEETKYSENSDGTLVLNITLQNIRFKHLIFFSLLVI